MSRQASPRGDRGDWLTTLYVGLSFYALGALTVENDVNYPTWRHIRAADFPTYHRAVQRRLAPAMFAPMTLQLLVGLAVLAAQPSTQRIRAMAVSLAPFAYISVESLLVQVPLHRQLNSHASPGTLAKLVRTHRRYRRPAQVIAAAATMRLLHSLITERAADPAR
jgi:hypothetical protein